jgi:hypothetical protein
VRGLNAEYEEETTRIQQMSADEKAELEKERRLESKIDWRGYDSDSDDD